MEDCYTLTGKESQDNLQEKQTTVQIAQQVRSPQMHSKYLPYRLEESRKLYQITILVQKLSHTLSLYKVTDYIQKTKVDH